MIARRLTQKLAAAAVFAAAAAVSVVAAGFALYALLKEVLHPAGAAAVVAIAAAVGAWVCAWIAGHPGGRRRDRDHADEDSSFGLGAGLMDRAADLVRERPLVATAAALAAGWIFIRNPALTTALAAILSGGRDRRR